MANAWDRRDDEPRAGYRAFIIFRNLGPTRSLKETAANMGLEYQTVANYSKTHNWFKRAEAWDDHRRKAEDEATLSEAQRLACEQLAAWSDVLDFGAKGARRLLERFDEPLVCPHCEEPIDGALMPSPRDVALFLEKATTFQRLIIGEATERTESRQQLDWGALDDEEKIELVRLLRKGGVDG